MRLETFLMERYQSSYEKQVELNLSESGVDPLTVRELLGTPGLCEELLDTQLLYTQTNGTLGLREAICAMYPGTDMHR